MAFKEDCEHTERFMLCPQCDQDSPLMKEAEEKLYDPTIAMTARYHADCPECGWDVKGQRIGRDPLSGRWVHVDCL